MSLEMPNQYVIRSKLRRQFESLFRDNDKNVMGFKDENIKTFSFKAVPHFIDRMIDRNVSFDEIQNILMAIYKNEEAINEVIHFINNPEREHRLEITDGTIWIGCTLNPEPIHNNHLISMRMVYKNDKRVEGKIDAKVVKI